jgi:positive regulator of sigma E activity
VGKWIVNPWRRLSILTISLLFGFFLGTAVSTTVGQTADLDIVAAGILVALIEVVDRVYYRRREKARSFWVESLNALKIGLTYSLFIEAFKLGS